jgi:hypothetical protein
MIKKQNETITQESKDFDVMLFTNPFGNVMMVTKELSHPVKCTDHDLLRMSYLSSSDDDRASWVDANKSS